MQRIRAVDAFAIFAWVIMFWLIAGYRGSPDLEATWIAAAFFAAGDYGNVYPPPGPLFTMQPPEAWLPLLEGPGAVREMFPYVYPPLWAALVAEALPYAPFSRAEPLATALNAALLVAIPVLAWRAARSPIPLAIWLMVAGAAMITTHVGFIAIKQNQPQILVSFLMVLAIERSRAEAPIAAGAALACAAAIKGYPALFAMLWLAGGNWRAVMAFAGFGGTLAAASIALAGWPLHAAFLAQLKSISATLLYTPISYNLNGIAIAFLEGGSFQFVESARAAASGQTSGWHVAQKPPAWILATGTGTALTLGWLAIAYRHASAGARHTLLWPLAIGTIALLAPLTWSYHYLPMFAFLPALLTTFGARRGAILLIVLLLPLQATVLPHYIDAQFVKNPTQFLGSVAMAGLVLAFLIAHLAPRHLPTPAAKPEPA
ncbi:MAG: glycosyltransferase 87 family protein [Pseudomonadota bacterium]